MNALICPAYDDIPSVRVLFAEYTKMLVDGDPKFAKYLAIQKYDDEIEHPELKYARPGGRLYLASCGGEAAGCVALKRIDGERCEMKRLYVRPQYRGNGIGLMLARRAIEDAGQIGYACVLLDTLPFLTKAIDMYKRMGFYEIERYNDNPLEDSIYLRLDICERAKNECSR